MLSILFVDLKNVRFFKKKFEHDRTESIHEAELIYQKISEKDYDILLIQGKIGIIPAIKKTDPRIQIIVIGRKNETDELKAIQYGVAAYFSEPVHREKFEKCIQGIRDLIRKRRETAGLERQLDEKYFFSGVVGRNPQMLEIFEYLNNIAPYYKNITLTGETGTGKEVLAKTLHSISPASKHPFIVCNCGGLVENLVESEFFGHMKGAFTGAYNDKTGIFEAAGEGTVFLDEIGDLPLSFQPHLLRVLQSGDFRKIGSTQAQQAKCKVIAATNRDLAEDVRRGRFRKDLFYRITALTINLPPLRERKDDIPLLSRFIIKRFCERTGKSIHGISRVAQTALMQYDWPGNVRELENIIEHAAILTKNDFIRLEILPGYIRESRKKAVFAKTLDDIVRQYIKEVLIQCNGNQTKAAAILGVSRRTLIRRMEKYSIRLNL